MTQTELLAKTAALIHEAAQELKNGPESTFLRGEVERLATEFESLSYRRRLPPAKDFKNKGAEVPLEPRSDVAPLSLVLERVIDESDLLPVSFLEQGVLVQRSVARIVLTRPADSLPAGSGWATGFLVSPTLFLTNNHAIEHREFLASVRFEFNYQKGPDGYDRETDSYQAGDFFVTEPDLDYTLVRLRSKQVANDPSFGTGPVQPGQRWGFVPLNPRPIFRRGQNFNIVQHPAGRQKQIALQNNEIEKLYTNVVLYETDTEPGSSGSPVFDNLWQLVALHHAGGEQTDDGKFLNNEGIRVDRIIKDLRDKLAGTAGAAVLEELGI